MKRYSILAREHMHDHEVELCQVDSAPEAIVKAAQQKTMMVSGGDGKRRAIPKYDHVYFKETGA